jgi:hypothetical protein
MVSTGIIFAFIYMCIYFLYCIHPPTLFPHHWYQHPLPCKTCSILLFSNFVEEKRKKRKNYFFDCLS